MEDIVLDVPQGYAYIAKLLKAVDLDPGADPTFYENLLPNCKAKASVRQKLDNEFVDWRLPGGGDVTPGA